MFFIFYLTRLRLLETINLPLACSPPPPHPPTPPFLPTPTPQANLPVQVVAWKLAVILLSWKKLLTVKTWSLSGSVAMAFSSAMFAFWMPTASRRMPASLALWACEAVFFWSLEAPSVMTTPMLGTPGRSPLVALNMTSLMCFRPMSGEDLKRHNNRDFGGETSVQKHTCTQAGRQAGRQARTHTHTHTHIYIYIHTHTYTHTHTYIHTYIHTHTHTRAHARTHARTHTNREITEAKTHKLQRITLYLKGINQQVTQSSAAV